MEDKDEDEDGEYCSSSAARLFYMEINILRLKFEMHECRQQS